MPDQPLLPARELERARDQVIETLSEHFAQDNISMDELERRIERVYAATNPVTISDALSGLPSLVPPAPVVEPSDALRFPEELSGKRRTLVAFMSGIVRRGAWIVPPRMRAVAFMGGVEIDLRDARLQAVTDIYAVAFMGGVVITVPPGVRVQADGFAIMGGFEDQLEQRASLDLTARLVRVRGVAFMGGVEVKVAERTGPDGPATAA
jgi:hypothetical protein